MRELTAESPQGGAFYRGGGKSQNMKLGRALAVHACCRCTCHLCLLIQTKASRTQLARIPSEAMRQRQTYRLSETTRNTGSTVVRSSGILPPTSTHSTADIQRSSCHFTRLLCASTPRVKNGILFVLITLVGKC